MLHYLRPRSGIRTVWIDALCINQKDVIERETQVAMMKTIYQSSLRVVVYLGEDIVKVDSRRHRPRHVLHDLDYWIPQSQTNLKQLLERRYFSRVWIIQELLLSPSIIIPIHDMDFSAGLLFSRNLQQSLGSDWDWDNTNAPWLQYVADGRAFSSNELLHVLRLTWCVQATDARDKIFGIMGLMDSSVSRAIPPDYSLTEFEVFVGIFAYAAFTLGHLELLANAAGDAAVSPYPSWMPNWRNPSMWAQKEDPVSDAELQNVHEWYHGQWSGRMIFHVLSCRGDVHHIDRAKKLWDDSDSDIESRSIPPDGQRIRRARKISAKNHTTNAFLGVEASTATMSFELVYLLKIYSKPELRARFDTMNAFALHLENETPLKTRAAHTLIVWTAAISLNEIIKAEPLDLFIYERPNDAGCVIFFPREETIPGTYTFVFSCPCYDLVLACSDATTPDNIPLLAQYECPPEAPEYCAPSHPKPSVRGEWKARRGDAPFHAPKELLVSGESKAYAEANDK